MKDNNKTNGKRIKEIEVKSIKIIQEDADRGTSENRKMNFDLNGKQKEETP